MRSSVWKNTDEIARYKYAPLASRDVEISFSKYKAMPADNRHGFKFESFKMAFVVARNAQ